MNMGGSRGGTGGLDCTEKITKIGFLSSADQGPLINHKATKSEFDVGVSLVGQ